MLLLKFNEVVESALQDPGWPWVEAVESSEKLCPQAPGGLDICC